MLIGTISDNEFSDTYIEIQFLNTILQNSNGNPPSQFQSLMVVSKFSYRNLCPHFIGKNNYDTYKQLIFK